MKQYWPQIRSFSVTSFWRTANQRISLLFSPEPRH